MSLKPTPVQPVPELTAQVAHTAFPKGNVYLQLRNELGAIYDDELFMDLYPNNGQPAAAPWRLALVTILQFAENLSDRQAADAVRSRIDWKYLLGMTLTDSGFNYSVLCEFRKRLIEGQAVTRLLERMLELFQAKGLLTSKGRQRTDSTHIVASVRDLSRLELVGTALFQALNHLAIIVPEWVKDVVPTAWTERYQRQWEDYRLPKNEHHRLELAEQVGCDSLLLLSAVYASHAFPWLRTLPAVETLRRIWMQNFYQEDDQVRWRHSGNLPPAAQKICSPFDLDARYCIKRQTNWMGYKVHLTETCEPNAPHMIVEVTTTPATQQDTTIVNELHHRLAQKALLPQQHLVDQGYSSSDALVNAKQMYEIEMVMPMRTNTHWQPHTPGAYELTDFAIDWKANVVICPQGQRSASWVQRTDPQGSVRFEVMFNQRDCQLCSARQLCTTAKRQRRKLTFRSQLHHELLQAARKRQETPEFKAVYAVRAGVEGTISQAVYALRMRRTRYRGYAKTTLHHVATAAAINLKRLVNWWNDVPFAQTRTSHFATLMAS